MSVAGISSSNYFDFNAQSVNNRMQLSRQDFQQLGKDLQSGDASAAKSDLTALESLRPQSSSSSATQTSNPVAQDFQQLSQDLQGGNATAAQQDYSKIQQEFNRRCRRRNPRRVRLKGPITTDTTAEVVVEVCRLRNCSTSSANHYSPVICPAHSRRTAH